MILYLAGVGLYAHRVYLTISKGGPMHEASLKCKNTVGLLLSLGLSIIALDIHTLFEKFLYPRLS